MENATTTAAVKKRRPTQTSHAGQTDWEPPGHPELARVLEGKRWEKREEPFQGFDSPKGKF